MKVAKVNGNGEVIRNGRTDFFLTKTVPAILGLMAVLSFLGKWTFGLKTVTDNALKVPQIETKVAEIYPLAMKVPMLEKSHNEVIAKLSGIDAKVDLLIDYMKAEKFGTKNMVPGSKMGQK